MHKFLWLVVAGGILVRIAAAQTNDTTSAVAAPPPTPAPVSTILQLNHGLNLGNFLEAPKEGAWGANRLLSEADFSNIAGAGFTLIRVPIRWSGHVSTHAPYTIDPAFLSRIDWVVAQARKNNLLAILDYHSNDEPLLKDPDAPANTDRFLSIWKQIAEHYQSEPSSIFFELLNEPNGKLDAVHWNALIAKALPVIRASNPTRAIIVGGVHWNNIDALTDLVLPDDDHNLIATFHFYDPMKFTHQGAFWIEGSTPWLGTTWQGTDADKLAVTQAFDKAAAWGVAHQRPIFLGEFGNYEKGDMASRARWTSCVVQTAASHGMPWTYWEYCSNFGAYDPVKKQWRQPILNALLQK